MPVHPSEENAPAGLTEKVAKDPSSTTHSTASEHEHHYNEHTPGGKVASAQDHQSKGPQIPMNMSDLPPKASKEELERRSGELNQ